MTISLPARHIQTRTVLTQNSSAACLPLHAIHDIRCHSTEDVYFLGKESHQSFRVVAVVVVIVVVGWCCRQIH